MIIVQKTITADNTDVLDGTDLANIPANGQLDIFIASTQTDTVATITGPGNEPIIRSQQVVKRTDGMPVMNTDIPYSIFVRQGGKYIVNIDITTGATVGIHAIFRSLYEI